MSDLESSPMGLPDARQAALSRWDNEGGAPSYGGQQAEAASGALREAPVLTNSELVLLRVRVIALENMVIALLAQASDEQRKVAQEMATYIAPRRGFTPHPLTVRASAHMTDLVHRAEHFRLVNS